MLHLLPQHPLVPFLPLLAIPPLLILAPRFLDKTGRTGSTLQLVNGIALMSTFLGVRLVYGGSVSLQFLFTLAQVWREMPLFYVIVNGCGLFILQGLNILWYARYRLAQNKSFPHQLARFSKMITAMRRRFESKPDTSAAIFNGSSSK
jgi:hypothetical protein